MLCRPRPRSRRCWSTGCRGTTPSAATTTSASRSTTAARCTSTTASRRRRIGETLRNLREISPTVYFNVPKGFEEIANALEDDAALRETLLRRVKMFFFAGAGLSQPVWDQLDRIAERPAASASACITGLGMTETAPFAIFADGTDVQVGPHRPAGAGRRGQARAAGRQDRGALPRPERHARLLARARADRRSVRRRRLLLHRRRGEARSTRRNPSSASCSTAASPRTSSSRPAPSSASARCARRSSPPARRCVQDVGRRRHQPRRHRPADLPAPRRVPRARRAAGRRLGRSRPRRRRGCASSSSSWSTCSARRHRQREPRRARARAGRAAVDRPRRDHRQGLDQPARGADAPRRARRAHVPRRRPRRDRPALDTETSPAMAETTHQRDDPVRRLRSRRHRLLPNFSRWMDAASLSFFMQCGVPPWRELVKTRGIVGTPLLEIQHQVHQGGDLRRRRSTIATHVEEWRAKVFVQHAPRDAPTATTT